MLQLKGSSMDKIGNHQQFVRLEHGMPGSMSLSIHRNDIARQYFSELKQMQTVFISIHRFHNLGIPVGRHLEPGIIFHFRCIHFSIRKHNTIPFHHSTDVIAMEMGKIQIFNIGRGNSQRSQAR